MDGPSCLRDGRAAGRAADRIPFARNGGEPGKIDRSDVRAGLPGARSHDGAENRAGFGMYDDDVMDCHVV